MDSPAKVDNCVVCCREVKVFAVGICDHAICHVCSTRLRVLCKQTECPICRRELPKVYFSAVHISYSDALSWRRVPINHRLKIYFENDRIQMEFCQLLDHSCQECPSKCSFRSFNSLKDHMRKTHEKFFCDLCVDHLHIFTYERKSYNRKELARHRRIGDADDKSHKGHPLCEFCDSRFMDSDELFKHLRRDHFFCHFCDSDGNNQYYSDYEVLRNHFRSSHFLCEEDDCIEEKFTTVFRTEIDLKAHRSQHHSKSMSKAQAKQTRTLEIEFAINPRSNTSGVVTAADYSDINNSRPGRPNKSSNRVPSTNVSVVSQAVQEQIPKPPPVQKGPNTNCVDEFPSLNRSGTSSASSGSDRSGSQTLANKLATHNKFSVRGMGRFNNVDDFPSLGSSGSYEPVPQVVQNYGASRPIRNDTKKSVKKGGPSISNNEDFPSLGPSKKEIAMRRSRPETQIPVAAKSERHINNNNSSSSKLQNSKSNFPSLPSSNKPRIATAAEVASSKPAKSNNKAAEVPMTKKSKSKKKNKKSTEKIEENSSESDSNKRKKKDKAAQNNCNNNIENIEPIANGKLETSQLKESSIPAGNDDNKSRAPPPGFNATVPHKVSSVPPGFKSSVPPGFTGESGFGTFTNSSSQDYTIKNSHYVYSQPEKFSERNQRLIQSIRTVLSDDNDRFVDFKSVSSEFRQDNVSAGEYYTKCLNVFGNKGFMLILPELLVLLPDISKQQQLLQVHKAFSKSQAMSKGAKPKGNQWIDSSEFSICAVCQQVLSSSDFRNHMVVHNMEENFPSLPNAKSDKSNINTHITWKRKP